MAVDALIDEGMSGFLQSAIKRSSAIGGCGRAGRRKNWMSRIGDASAHEFTELFR
jgi:hypothetical protein